MFKKTLGIMLLISVSLGSINSINPFVGRIGRKMSGINSTSRLAECATAIMRALANHPTFSSLFDENFNPTSKLKKLTGKYLPSIKLGENDERLGAVLEVNGETLDTILVSHKEMLDTIDGINDIWQAVYKLGQGQYRYEIAKSGNCTFEDEDLNELLKLTLAKQPFLAEMQGATVLALGCTVNGFASRVSFLFNELVEQDETIKDLVLLAGNRSLGEKEYELLREHFPKIHKSSTTETQALWEIISDVDNVRSLLRYCGNSKERVEACLEIYESLKHNGNIRLAVDEKSPKPTTESTMDKFIEGRKNLSEEKLVGVSSGIYGGSQLLGLIHPCLKNSVMPKGFYIISNGASNVETKQFLHDLAITIYRTRCIRNELERICS
ncbi:MAG: hypothetical protein ACOX3T_03445 [Bdellovibrionota bacterium]